MHSASDSQQAEKSTFLSSDKMDQSTISTLPYTATTLSVIGRFIFMYLLYRNRSTNSLSLTFCGLNIVSSVMWLYYSAFLHDTPMVVRSSTEITLLVTSALYIVRNKVKARTTLLPQ